MRSARVLLVNEAETTSLSGEVGTPVLSWPLLGTVSEGWGRGAGPAAGPESLLNLADTQELWA